MNRIFLLCLNKFVIIFSTIYSANLVGLGYSLSISSMVQLSFRRRLFYILGYAFQSNWRSIFKTYYYQLFFIYVYLISLSGFLYLWYYNLFSEWQRTDRISNNLITDSSSRTTLCHTEVLYYGFHHYRFLWILWISSTLSRSLEGSIIAHLIRAIYFLLLFSVGQSTEVLAVFFYQYTLRQYYYSTVRRLIQQEGQEMSRSRVIGQLVMSITLN